MSPESHPQRSHGHEPERVYERAADPAEAADRPLEPKSSDAELAERDEPDPQALENRPAPHHALNTPVGEPDPAADSDPFRHDPPDEQGDRASGASGVNQGAEDR